jgi:hypothetical protein
MTQRIARFFRSTSFLIVLSGFLETAWKLAFVYAVVWGIHHQDYASAAASFMLFIILMDFRKDK